MKRARTIMPVLLAGLCLVAPGCFEIDVELLVAKDGSGTVTQTIHFSKMVTKMAAADEDAPAAPGGWSPLITQVMTNREPLNRAASQLGQDVTFTSAQPIRHADGREGIRLVFACKDVSKVNLATSQQPPGDADEDDDDDDASGGMMPGLPFAMGGDKAESYTLSFQKADPSKNTPAKLTIKSPKFVEEPKPGQPEQPAAPAPDKEMAMAMAKAVMADMRMRVAIKVDGKITRSNAAHISDDKTSVTLMDMRLGEIVKDDALWKKFQDLEKAKSVEELRQKLQDADLKKVVTMETQPTVEIEFN